MSYGEMCSYDDAIKWAESMPDSEAKDHALNRMRYERDKTLPVDPTFHKGVYGKKFDHHTCGHCGVDLEVWYKYCPNCGFYIGKRRYR